MPIQDQTGIGPNPFWYGILAHGMPEVSWYKEEVRGGRGGEEEEKKKAAKEERTRRWW